MPEALKENLTVEVAQEILQSYRRISELEKALADEKKHMCALAGGSQKNRMRRHDIDNETFNILMRRIKPTKEVRMSC